MTADLFSSLDGCQSIWSWLTPIVLSCVFITNSAWLTSSSSVKVLFLSAFTESKKSLLPLPVFSFSLMLFLVNLNLIGLAPFVYGATSALWVASSLALTLWGMLILSGWVHKPKESAAHLAPAGAPAALISFLVVVETISILIRPLTLTVRLIANISAGHIVLSLVANCLTSMSLFGGAGVLLVSVGYTLFEVFVCFIQAYIFTLLVGLYAQEHP
uniref:ATP synthase subunit a n=1 Tax=Platevindex mortoni TaxID=637517 RepID=D3YHQ5_9EUPU|nr:ATP synthase F0 subunit 6 [Platevindex mortoni]ADD37175.1 ATP synthase F0 subunit 6 [Platevindex mortoni]UZH97747.1 ATP synthase F0 subunit 6 [Platevindex mortoni]